MKNPLIAVYAISKNEEKHCHRWYNSCKDADKVIVVDTGSSDATVASLTALGVDVIENKISPWRFDDARNSALDLIPKNFNIAVVLDLDEILCDGWREKVEALWNSIPGVTEIRHLYAWSPDHIFSCSRFHSVADYKWIKPVHEVQVHKSGKPVSVRTEDILIHHLPDASKSRGQYLELLKQSVVEYPDDSRNCFYYGRELFYYKQWSESIIELSRFLLLPTATWSAERSAACVFVSICKKNLGNPKGEESWLLRACAEDSSRREAWYELGNFYRLRNDFGMGYACAIKALSIKNRPYTYLDNDSVWVYRCLDLASVCAFYSGHKSESIAFAKAAMDAKPDDQRLRDNYDSILKSMLPR